MLDLLNRIKERLLATNERLSTPQKIAFVGLFALLVAGLGALGWYSTQPNYRLLRGNLTDAEKHEICARLEGMDVVCDPRPGAIYVPEESFETASMALAVEGIGGSGSDDLEKIEFGLADKIVDRRLLRAREKELARTIESIEEIIRARVHIAVPKPELFAKDQKPPRASVVIQTKRGSRLAKKQVGGIVNLLTGAVAGLEPEHVAVMDHEGTPLKPVGEGQSVVASTMLEHQRNVERRLEEKAAKVLRDFLGPDKFEVVVTAEVDFSQEERREEVFEPESQVARSETTATMVREAAGPRVGGVAGAPANEAGATGLRQVGGDSNSSEERITTNYEISKIVKRIQRPGASLAKLSIAVVVDGSYKPGIVAEDAPKDAPPPEPVYVERLPADLVAIEKMVAKAVGLNAERGDQIQVSNLRFQTPVEVEVDAALEAKRREQFIERAIRWGLVLLVALVAIFFVFRPLVRWLTAKPDEVELVEEGALPPGELAALPGQDELAQMEDTDENLIETVKARIQKNPEVAAAVIRYWLREAEA